jgi:hypothetical protein
MSRFVRAALAAVTFAAFAALAPVSKAAAPTPPNAGKALTFPYPAKAPVVVQLNGLGAARERLTAMLKAALPDDVDTINKQVDEALKQLLGERKLTAIPKDGRVFLVVNDIASLFENTPAVSLLVPVTSYKEFRATFLTDDERKTFEAGNNGIDEVKVNVLGDEHAVFLVDLKEYVALTPDKGTAETYTNKYTRATTAAMSPELAKSFVDGDLSIYVNLDVINDKYGDQIRAFKGLIDFALQQAQMGGMLPGINKKQLEAAKTMIHGVFQAVEDCRGLVLTAEFRPDGLNLRLQAQFAEDTTSVKLLKAETPGPQSDVAKLPAGLNSYSGSSFGKKIIETVHGLSPEFAPADDDEKGNEAIEKLQKELLAAGLKSDVSASGAPDVALNVATYTDPKKAVAATIGCYEAMSAGGRIQSVVLKDAPKTFANARKYKGFTFTEVRLSYDFEATVRDLPENLRENTLAQIKRTVGEKMLVWIGTDGKSVVELSGKNWDTASSALERFFEGKEPLGDTDGYKLTRKNLPADASLLMMFETAETLTMLLDTLRALEGTIPDFPKIGKIKPLKGDHTFIGVAVTLKGDTASANLFVPTPAIAAGRKMLENLFKNIE